MAPFTVQRYRYRTRSESGSRRNAELRTRQKTTSEGAGAGGSNATVTGAGGRLTISAAVPTACTGADARLWPLIRSSRCQVPVSMKPIHQYAQYEAAPAYPGLFKAKSPVNA